MLCKQVDVPLCHAPLAAYAVNALDQHQIHLTSEDGLWAIKSYTGLEDASSITEAAAFEPMMGSMAFSMVMVRVAPDADIKSVADLEGKKVSIGDRGSGVYFNAIDVLEIYGLSEDKISPVYQGFGDSADSLKDGKIDAAFVVAGAPTTAITDLATAGNVYLISIDQEHADKLIEASPFYSPNTIPAGTYI